MPNLKFFEWVTTLRAADNPRGDFIRDTRDAFNLGGKAYCENVMLSACPEANHERDRLWREWKIAKEREIPA